MTAAAGDGRGGSRGGGALREWVAPVGLALLTVGVFFQVRHFQFLEWDDDWAVTANSLIRSVSPGNVAAMFTDMRQTLRYQPVSFVCSAVVYRLFGQSAAAFHLWNVVVHAGNVVLVYALLRRLLGRWGGGRLSEGQAVYWAAVGAAVWGLHPLRVEVVAWVAQACFAEATGLALGAVLLYLKAVEERPGAPWRAGAYWWAAGCYLLGVLAFPNVVGVPAVLWLADAYVLRAGRGTSEWRRVAGSLVATAPFWVAAVVASAATVMARHTAGTGWPPPPTWAEFPLWDRVAQACYVLTYYLWKPLDVRHVSSVYTVLIGFEPRSAGFVGSVAFVVVMSVVAVVMRRRWPWLLVLWGAHVALVLPMAGLFDKPHYPSDRYSYLQGVLFSVALCAAVARGWGARRAAATKAGPGLVPAGIAGVVAAGLVVLTARQTGVWRDGGTFFRHILAELGDDPYRWDIHWRLARFELAQGDLDAAEADANESIALKRRPNPRAWEVRGAVYFQRALKTAEREGATARAAAEFREAGLAYRHAAAQSQLLESLLFAAEAFAASGDLASAESCMGYAAPFAKGNGHFARARAQILFQQGREDAARELVRDPKSFEAWGRLPRLPGSLPATATTSGAAPAAGAEDGR